MSKTREKRGYLKEDFRLFHLRDKSELEFKYHFHEFLKMVIFISGDVTYMIEGKVFKMEPWDILLISSDDLHRPVISPQITYDRIIIWMDVAFLRKHSSREANLEDCFLEASRSGNYLIRTDINEVLIKSIVYELEKECSAKQFGSRILGNSLIIQLMVNINRLFPGGRTEPGQIAPGYDGLIDSIIDHINANLQADLSVESISGHFYLSRYYLMRRFKEQTGYSMYKYILQKRLLKARTHVTEGMSVSDVCSICGFNNYSSFIRSFKNNFGLPPGQYYKKVIQVQKKQETKTHF